MEEATGNKRYAVEILSEEVRLLGGGRRNEGALGDDQRQEVRKGGVEEGVPELSKDASDLPF